MILDFIMATLNKFLDMVLGLLDKLLSMLKIDIFVDELKWIIELIQPLNFMLPIKEVLWVLSILCTFAFGALIFWIVQEIVKLIRG